MGCLALDISSEKSKLKLVYASKDKALAKNPKTVLRVLGKDEGAEKSRIDYYPFGMLMPGRQYNSGAYRFGFQGQEVDNEIKGVGNSVNYKYRIHDPRLGRFLSVDPLAKTYSYNSPYAFSENRVIDAVELEGLEKYIVHYFYNQQGTVTRIRIITNETVEGAVRENNIVNDGEDLTEMDVYVYHLIEGGNGAQFSPSEERDNLNNQESQIYENNSGRRTAIFKGKNKRKTGLKDGTEFIDGSIVVRDFVPPPPSTTVITPPTTFNATPGQAYDYNRTGNDFGPVNEGGQLLNNMNRFLFEIADELWRNDRVSQASITMNSTFPGGRDGAAANVFTNTITGESWSTLQSLNARLNNIRAYFNDVGLGNQVDVQMQINESGGDDGTSVRFD